MDTTSQRRPAMSHRRPLALRSTLVAPRLAFTLVELLVVITIIGILAALITAAAIAALRASRQASTKVEVSEISTALESYKDKAGSYPPNLISDAGTGEPAIDRTQVLNDLRRHLQQAFPRHREPDVLLKKLVDDTTATAPKLTGGMTAEEAIVFWLGGFSADPQYPISGEGGPSYNPADPTTMDNNDPIEGRRLIYPFDIARLGPRDSNGMFDDSMEAGARYITYQDPRDPTKQRRVNFWRYRPNRSEVPYVYFDTSRYTPDKYDPPASSALHVHALKQVSNPSDPPASWRILFANAGKYQVLHCGIDDRWGEELSDRTSYEQFRDDPNLFLTFPTGPFTGELADTVVNFITQSRLEDAQPQ
jgi:prepilin-type N-terminal cleavage/methylation domain-containing protein